MQPIEIGLRMYLSPPPSDFVHFMRIEAMAGEVMDILFQLAEDKEIRSKIAHPVCHSGTLAEQC